ncbi:hypothetical protein [Arenimonas oryziterrae]|uniref:Lipoprotein n=1 Tax=Arenimonas oryziterrae DSM 21050 = YC6267 TaxID=1121015 RepID=A0A091BDY0_9GAMM|nr:hypothetical protein [Arenimonas oryziterrae]KFN42615.1 hypothetical protein N789_13320 [Arenimonas oryziterrae DSM 21050 = YC6267]
MKRLLILAALSGFALVACTASREPESAAAAPVANQAGVEFVLTPAAMRACEAPINATVSWRVDASTGTSEVRVVTVDGDGVERLFSDGGGTGSQNTGNWVTPAIVLILRDRASGRELGRTRMQSLPCH